MEADDQQVNLTRFSLFFPEKRQFFQERAATFEFGTGARSQLFHSRTIGLDEDRPVRIYGGVRAVGRTGKTDFGFLTMQTAESDSLPSENFGVLRVRHEVLNAYSTVGAMATTRAGTDGSYNVAVAADGSVRPFGDEYVTIKFAHTFDADDPVDSRFVDRSHVSVNWERRTDNGLAYSAGFIRSGRDYNPKLGFTNRSDYRFGRGHLQYQWLLGAASPLRAVQVSTRGFGVFRNADGTAESVDVETSLGLEFKSGWEAALSVAREYESVRDTFELDDGLFVPFADYWSTKAELEVQRGFVGSIRPRMSVTAGSFFDGWRVGANGGADWNPSRHVQIGATYAVNVIRFPDRQESLDTHLARLRLQVALNVHFSINTFVQYNSTEDLVGVNARIRYHFREGQDLWLVYNESLNAERGIGGTPRLPTTQDRTVLVKFTYTIGR